MKGRFGPWLLTLALLDPSVAWALQAHGQREGHYVHQGGHLFYAVAMVVFALRIYLSPLFKQKPWRHWSLGLWLLALWNIWAFAGHQVGLAIPPEFLARLPEAAVPSLRIESARELLYYVLSLDHLICVPAMFFLYRGLSRMHLDTKP